MRDCGIFELIVTALKRAPRDGFTCAQIASQVDGFGADVVAQALSKYVRRGKIFRIKLAQRSGTSRYFPTEAKMKAAEAEVLERARVVAADWEVVSRQRDKQRLAALQASRRAANNGCASLVAVKKVKRILVEPQKDDAGQNIVRIKGHSKAPVVKTVIYPPGYRHTIAPPFVDRRFKPDPGFEGELSKEWKRLRGMAQSR